MICILEAGRMLTLAGLAFTLSWSHSVEKTGWEEDWKVTPAGLELSEARIRGSGAGMEPPPSAVLRNGWWVYAPARPPLPELVLAASGATAGGWKICDSEQCIEVGTAPGAPVRISICEPRDGQLPRTPSR